ncbi:AAEL012048-PA [Aedes aegypti]|uniref:AAEL012048-PA n=1 Tax=Aedes aegypti TaxID=7159 RepID=Q16N93_AEDAE|nr:AAEL012048-PA [Aedes aegypti]
MSTSRYLNWSRPSPGRHHPLRKQVSCFESFSGGGRSLSVNNLATSVSTDKSADFATFVTAAIIHKNRFQSYNTYHQAHSRDPVIISGGTSTTLGSDGPPRATPRRRPASAHTSSSSSMLSGTSAMARKLNAHESRKVLTKQLSLDHPNVGGGPPAGHAWTTTASRTASVCGPSPVGFDDQSHGVSKTCGSSGIKKRPPGAGVKNDAEPNEHIKKALKQGKDSRINIKIFLGQSVQQDSSDTGHSDTECSPNQSQQQQHHRNQNQSNSQQQQQQQQQQKQHNQQQQGNQKAEAENSNEFGCGATFSGADSRCADVEEYRESVLTSISFECEI